MDVGVYMGFTREDIDNAESIEDLLEGQKKFFGSLKDSLRQTAVINMDGKLLKSVLSLFNTNSTNMTIRGVYTTILNPKLE